MEEGGWSAFIRSDRSSRSFRSLLLPVLAHWIRLWAARWHIIVSHVKILSILIALWIGLLNERMPIRRNRTAPIRESHRAAAHTYQIHS